MAKLNPNILDLVFCQTHSSLGLAYGRTQVYWVWRFVRPMIPWA